MGRTSGFVIHWPVTSSVKDGRTFRVALADDGDLRIQVDRADNWLDMGRHHSPSMAAVVGCTLRWWYDTMGEPLFLVKPPER
jgi:hypothetical protein